MSDVCHVCGPVKHEAPTVLCAACALVCCPRMAWGDCTHDLDCRTTAGGNAAKVDRAKRATGLR